MYVPYFEQVVKAHCKNQPIPPIPTALYLRLNPIIDPLPTEVAAGKRKVQDVRPAGMDGVKEKQQRTDPAEEGDEDEEEESEGEEEKDELKIDDEEEEVEMDVDDAQNEDDQDTPLNVNLPPELSQPTSLADPSTSLKLKLRPPPVVEIQSRKKQSCHPSDGLTAQQLEDSWQAQAGTNQLKRTPVRSMTECDFCQESKVICWTVPGMKACVYCRYDKKRACSNTPARAPKPTKNAADDEEPKDSKPKKATKQAKANVEKTVNIVPPAATIASARKSREKKPPTNPTVELAKKRKVTVVPLDAPPQPAASPPPQSQPTKAHPTRSMVPSRPSTPTSSKVPAISQQISTGPATPRKPRSQTNSQANSVIILAAPPALDVNPLVCPPASSAELLCTYSLAQFVIYETLTT